MRLVHLTDLHMTEPRNFSKFIGKRCLGYFSWRRRRRFIHKKKVLDLITQSVLSENPDLVAITGDLVQLGMLEEIQEAESWLRTLSKKTQVFVVPGNHDIYAKSSIEMVRDLWRPYTHLIASSYPGILENDSAIIIGLSSACPTPFWSAAGHIGIEQLERLHRILVERKNRFVCVLLHHPITAEGVPLRKQLKDLYFLQSELSKCGPNLILHGHLHHNKEYELAPNIPVFCTASASCSKRGIAASYRVIDLNFRSKVVDVSSVLKTLDVDNGVLQKGQVLEWRSDCQRVDSHGSSS